MAPPLKTGKAGAQANIVKKTELSKRAIAMRRGNTEYLRRLTSAPADKLRTE
jgi:hypothetical protein